MELPKILVNCDTHGETECEYLGVWINSPVCKKCLSDFKSMCKDLTEGAQQIPIIED